MPDFFSMRFVTVETNQSRDATPSVRTETERLMASRRALRLLDEHRAWAMVDNMALIIMDQTYSALLEILGPAAAPSGEDGHVQFSRPVDPADPASPLLSVNASATHCCISLTNSAYGGATPEYARYTSPKQRSTPQHRLARATVSVSPGMLHLARADGGRRRGDDHYWRCAEVRPDVSEKGLLGVLEAIKSRLDAAIRLEARMIEMARASGCRSAKVGEIVEVRAALEKMRGEVDLDAIMRRRCQKRRRIIQEIGCGPDVDQEVDDAEVLTKRFRAMHVSQKRPRRVEEISCRPAADMDDAEMLSKRLRAMHV